MRKKRELLVRQGALLACALCCAAPVAAQVSVRVSTGQQTSTQRTLITVKGRVADKEGHSLPGVTVLRKGNMNGVITDIDGRFQINVPKGADAVLQFSFVGMETKEVRVKASALGEKELEIRLDEDAQQLDEVVVTGFVNFKKESFTGNSTTIRKEELQRVSKTNVIKALQAFDPSFRIAENTTWGSDPNALPEVSIRGNSGIGVKELDAQSLTSKSNLQNNPNLPTFIMDGFEIDVTKLYDMDPSRIESITILKDAAATAMYGSRAANGVVVITTVTPKPGKLNVQYSFTGEVEAPDLSDYHLLNAAEKLEAERLAGCYVSDTPADQERLNEEYQGKLYNVRRGVDTYWLSKPLRTVFNHNHSLYIDGGTENLRFGVDLNYKQDDGVMKGSGRRTMGGGMYLDYRINKLQVRNYVSFNTTHSQESPYGSFSDYTTKQPYDVYTDENGNYLEELEDWHMSGTITNPLYEAGLHNFDKSSYNELIDNLSLQWNITHHLLWKASLGVTYQTNKSDRFLDPLSKKNTNPISSTNYSSGELTTGSGSNLNWDFQSTLSYNQFFGKHNLNFSLGFNAQETQTESVSTTYRGFPSGILHSPNYAQEVYEKPSTSENTTRQMGGVGVFNYSYDNIYLFDASIRVEGSSEFGADEKCGTFWSTGVGLNLHNYEAISDLGFFDLLKLRGSYGQTGAVNFAPYQAETTYQIFTDEWYKTGYGATLYALGNEALRWETTNTLDVGFEVSFLRRLFYLKASYYVKRTTDMVNDVTIPSHTGFTTYKDNVGEVENRGFELDFRSDIFRNRDWYVSIFANLAHNRNKILKISDSLRDYNKQVQDYYSDPFNQSSRSQPLLQYVEGGSMNSIWGVRSLGIDPASGKELFLRPDGTVTDTWRPGDQVVIGNKEPDGQGTFGFSASWRNFSLYTTFMYEFGGQRYNQTLVDKVEDADIYDSNVDYRVLTDRWQKPGDVSKFQALQAGVNNIAQTQPTSRFVQDYNYLTLNSLSLEYTFDNELIAPWGLSMLRLELSANDLFYASTVKQERGLSYPYSRSVSFAVKASF